jgi:ubiquinone/menaquinone biosynthesis C-methylase UbiE
LNEDAELARFPVRTSELDRFKFGKKWYCQIARFQKGNVLFCLDVGCGHKPFPKANVLCDLNVERVPDRRMQQLVTEGKPFVMCDCGFLPFKDKAFDFVTSYYLVEHVCNPVRLYGELRRVSRHGYIQCPSWFNEILYGEEVHKWTVAKRGNRLYIKSIGKRSVAPRFGFVFHRLYRSGAWRVLHAILDETLHLFTVCYRF